MKKYSFFLFNGKFKILCILSLSAIYLAGCGTRVEVEERILSDNWWIASTETVGGDAASVSSQTVDPSKWTQTTVPATVLGALVDAGVYPDPFFGKNLEDIPREPFEKPWWYKTTFQVRNFNEAKEQLRLMVDGINYRANVWVNGKQIAREDTVFGAFRLFELDISKMVKNGENTLLFEIHPPQVRDFYMGFVDWAPTPPDHYMGIYREVRLRRSGKVSLDEPFIAPDLDPANLNKAWLTVSAELTNHSDQNKTVTLAGQIENIRFEKEYNLAPGQHIIAVFEPSEFEQLIINNPRLWWPNGLGSPEMYEAKLELFEGKNLIDKQNIRFGIRKIEDYLTENNVRGYKVNGREVLIKSGGWVDDLFLRYMPEKDAAQIRYAKEMNMNSLRFEGVWGNNHHIYDLCDDNGILLMVGWSCQWEWPDYLGLELIIAEEDENLPINEGVDLYAVKLTPEEEDLLSDYFRDQVKWLRNHPSIFSWAGGSDAMPKPRLEKKYLETLEKYDPTRPFLLSAGDFTSEITGVSGMKMNGPYEYVAPIYWFEDKKLGGAFGFNSETGPGPQVPPISSIRKMMPEEDLWPPDNDMWRFHSGRKDFNSIGVYLEAKNKRYGESKDLEEFAYKAQLMNYEAMRPMFEAFVVNRKEATGVVQWMQNSPWPEFYWQLYDYYLMPTGAYYGTMKSLQFVNLIYDYHNHSVHFSNDTRDKVQGLKAQIKLLDINSKVVHESEHAISADDNSYFELEKLPALRGNRQVYFLDLRIKDAQGKQIADNFYWLPTFKDQMDWSKYFWYYTPIKQYADFSALNTMPEIDIKAEKQLVKKGEEWEVKVNLENPSDHIAFFIELELAESQQGDVILPVFWSDNYVTLLPGESKSLTVKFYGDNFAGSDPVIRVQGYNLKQKLNL
ncbi:MAG: beta galactosidase jelly roll domain-containing protein [Cyclobacteriaceae bacterium]|nr:beta galactosidase jelly roll domain-containing protein [Cyclobacteriaceae bacterium]